MGPISKRSYAWHDDDDSLEEQLPTDLGMAGLPEHWRHYGWTVAAILFAAFWLLEPLTSGGTPLTDMAKVNGMAHGIWGLLVVLTMGIGLFQLRIRRRPSVGFNLCILIAVAALLSHTL